MQMRIRTMGRWPGLAMWLTLLSLAGCGGARFVIPEQPSVREQYEYARRMEGMYRSPLSNDTKEDAYDRAMEAYDRVLELFPTEQSYVGLSRLRMAMLQEDELERLAGQERLLNKWRIDDRREEILREYKALLRDYPENDTIQINALYGAGWLSELLGDPVQAKDYYREILQRFGETSNPDFTAIVDQSRFLYNRPVRR